MSVPKLFTLCLILGSFTSLLVSTHCAGSVFLVDPPPEAVIIIDKIGKIFFSAVVFALTSLPAIFLALASLAAWFFLVRKPAQQRREATAQATTRESSLQDDLDRITERLLDPTRDPADREASARNLGLEQVMARELDGVQKERLSVFLYETGLTPEPVQFSENMLPEIEEPARLRVSRRAALVVTAILAVASFGFFLIGLTTCFMAWAFDLTVIFLGKKTTPGEIVSAFTMWLVPSIASAASAVGFWWLFRHEQRSSDQAERGLEASKASLMRSTRRAVERILEVLEATSDPACPKLLRARVLSALPGLDAGTKGELLTCLDTLGCLGPHIGLDLTGADFSSVRLSEIHIESACLSGVSLANADLRLAQLHEVDLSRCNLSGCDLRGADLCACDLRQSNLSQARLKLTHLRECDLSFAHVTTEQLRATASLEGTVLPSGRTTTELRPSTTAPNTPEPAHEDA